MNLWLAIALISIGVLVFSVAFIFLGIAAEKDRTTHRLSTAGLIGMLLGLSGLVVSVAAVVVENIRTIR